MGELDGMDFGADTDAIRRWLAKRATYADDLGDPVRGGKHRVDLPGTVDPQRMTVPNARDAGQHVLDALVAPDPPVATRWPARYEEQAPAGPSAGEPEDAGAPADATSGPAAEVRPVLPVQPVQDAKKPRPPSPYASTPEREEALTSSRSTNAVFKPRLGARRGVTLALVAVTALTAGAAYQAYQEGTTLNYGLAGLLALLTLVVWAVRASTSVTEMAVIRGQLEIIRNGKFEVIDLANSYTPIVIEGRPGHRRSKVLIERLGQPILVIDRSVVDPREFHSVLHRVRPDLRPKTATPAR